ncbi:MAG: pyrroloquinoline quinone-dependent dehydrogenase, partial [Micropepsaceae bacterium]
MIRLVILLIVGLAFAQAAFAEAEPGWSHYGGDAGGMRYSPAQQITPENVDQLIRAWTYRTGELETRRSQDLRQMKFQTTPVLHGDSLYLC